MGLFCSAFLCIAFGIGRYSESCVLFLFGDGKVGIRIEAYVAADVEKRVFGDCDHVAFKRRFSDYEFVAGFASGEVA